MLLMKRLVIIGILFAISACSEINETRPLAINEVGADEAITYQKG